MRINDGRNQTRKRETARINSKICSKGILGIIGGGLTITGEILFQQLFGYAYLIYMAMASMPNYYYGVGFFVPIITSGLIVITSIVYY